MRASRRGMTLIELLVVLVIGSVISGVIVTLLLGEVKLSATQNRTMINQQNLRESLDYMADEIASCGAGTTEPFISTAQAQQLQFISDIDGDGQWNRIKYYMNGTDLKRTLWTSSNQGTSWTQVSDDKLLSGVSNLTFNYYQRGNSTTSNTALITMVEIKITQSAAYNTTGITSGDVATGRMSIKATIRNRML